MFSVITIWASKVGADFSFVLCSAAMEANQDAGSKENPENNPDFTTVYVGNLGHEVKPSFC